MVDLHIIFVGSSGLSIVSHIAEYVKQTRIFPWLIVLQLYLVQWIVLGYGIALELSSQYCCKNVRELC